VWRGIFRENRLFCKPQSCDYFFGLRQSGSARRRLLGFLLRNLTSREATPTSTNREFHAEMPRFPSRLLGRRRRKKAMTTSISRDNPQLEGKRALETTRPRVPRSVASSRSSSVGQLFIRYRFSRARVFLRKGSVYLARAHSTLPMPFAFTMQNNERMRSSIRPGARRGRRGGGGFSTHSGRKGSVELFPFPPLPAKSRQDGGGKRRFEHPLPTCASNIIAEKSIDDASS